MVEECRHSYGHTALFYTLNVLHSPNKEFFESQKAWQSLSCPTWMQTFTISIISGQEVLEVDIYRYNTSDAGDILID